MLQAHTVQLSYFTFTAMLFMALLGISLLIRLLMDIPRTDRGKFWNKSNKKIARMFDERDAFN